MDPLQLEYNVSLSGQLDLSKILNPDLNYNQLVDSFTNLLGKHSIAHSEYIFRLGCIH